MGPYTCTNCCQPSALPSRARCSKVSEVEQSSGACRVVMPAILVGFPPPPGSPNAFEPSHSRHPLDACDEAMSRQTPPANHSTEKTEPVLKWGGNSFRMKIPAIQCVHLTFDVGGSKAVPKRSIRKIFPISTNHPLPPGQALWMLVRLLNAQLFVVQRQHGRDSTNQES